VTRPEHSRDARYRWLLLAESHLTRRLLGAMVRQTAALLAATIHADTAGRTIGAGQAGKIGPAEPLNRPSNTNGLPFMMAT